MGTKPGLFDTTVKTPAKGSAAVVGAWQTYLLVVASIGGLLLIQSPYQSGPMS